MKATIIFFVMLIACALAIFVIPHHKRREYSFKPLTLGGVYQDFISDMPRITDRWTWLFLLLGIMGIFSSFYSGLIVLMMRWIYPRTGEAGGAWFILGD